MKAISYILLMSLMTIVTACTQNDGHIGKFFGSWVLTEMTVGNTATDFPQGQYTTMSFQNDVVKFILHQPDGSYEERFGTWTESDGMLKLDFTHSDDRYDAGTAIYRAPEWLDFPAKTITDLLIADMTDGKLTLVLDRTDGEEIVYKFERTW